MHAGAGVLRSQPEDDGVCFYMTSLNKKKKGKNSYLLKANKYSNKMKRINFFNKVNRNKTKDYDSTGY